MNQAADSLCNPPAIDAGITRMRRARVLFAIFFVIGIGALALSGYLYWAQSRAADPSEPGLTIIEPEREFDKLVVGEHYEFEIHIVNGAADARRVIGAEYG